MIEKSIILKKFSDLFYLKILKQILLCLLIMPGIKLMMPVPVYGENKPIKLAFFNKMTPKDYWWYNASQIMQAACDDFGIELEIYYAGDNQFLMTRQLQQVVNSATRVNGVIFSNVKKNIIQLLKIAEKAKIPAFIFNAGLTETEMKIYGRPREKFSYWVGQILPEDEQAGYDLAKILFAQAKNKGLSDSAGRLHVLGIGGTISDIAAIKREKGLLKAVKDDPNVILHQIAPANWDKKRGRSVFLGLKSRYPDVKVVWAANDPMGLGVIEGIKALQLMPGKDILVGSIDWIPEAVEAIKSGELSVSIGGHYMESAWSVVLLYDYLNNHDFSEESVSFASTMGILTLQNLEDHIKNFGQGSWEKVNFRKFSKKLNPHINIYNFKLNAVMNQISN